MHQSNYAHSLLALLTSRTRLKGKKQGGILLRFECKEGWLIKTQSKAISNVSCTELALQLCSLTSASV